MDMTTTAIGQSAEEQAAQWLESHSFEILERNWKTRWCEIDIVARRCSRGWKRSCSIHFVEVKYRRTNKAGEAVEYVTQKKQQQMTFAAQHWVQERSWDGAWQLDVIGINGQTNKLEYIQNITQ